MDKKLKTDFSEFWREAGGHETDDGRFDELPLVEPRKTMDEVPTRKRAGGTARSGSPCGRRS